MMERELFSQLEERGYQGRIVSIKYLDDLRAGIEGHRERGFLDDELYQKWLTRFVFSPSNDLPGAKSLIVVAVPQPLYRILFTWEGQTRPFLIPPTYVGYNETKKRVGELLAQILGPQGYRVEKATLPEKLLAVQWSQGSFRNWLCDCVSCPSSASASLT